VSKKNDTFRGMTFTKDPHETSERLAEQFHKDMKSCRIFKTDGTSEVVGEFKKPMSTREIIERTREAMKD
jgi:hypothetical protein